MQVSASLTVWTVQFTEVNTESQAPILLLDQDNCTSPWTVQLLDGTNVQYFIEMGLYIIIHVGGIHW